MCEAEHFDVIILGAGAAGIATGIDLLQSSSSTPTFIILESRDRIGGRCYTDQKTLNVPVDLGATWIHHYSPSNPLYKYHHKLHTVQKKRQEVKPLRRHSVSLAFDYDGKPLSESVYRQAHRIAGSLFEILDKYALEQRRKEVPEDKSIEDVIQEAYQSFSLGGQLKRAVDIILSGLEQYEGSNFSRLSAINYDLGDGMGVVCDMELENGFGTFLTQIATVLHQLPIRLNQTVTCIDTTDSHKIQIQISEDKIYTCKYVLVTIPLGCLKRQTIKFVPELPEWKTLAISQMGFGLMNKIVLQFPKNFWGENVTVISHASNVHRGQFRFIITESQANILIIFVTGDFAYKMETLTDEETLITVMQFIRTIFSEHRQRKHLVPDPTHYLISRWCKDPYAYGSYSNFAVNANVKTVEDLARECYSDRVYWAGEHTNFTGSIGCVDSAFESGQREARKLIEKLQSS
ncbi:unnamed protein product [Didymodactylos carnosus]|uniref:Amine oxidase n=1 Tax=Didymodactylos carnosus TaxID=1234261 RepID=A0A815LJ19_9BILA|nr:unnamed protein product [Didymodactylos carnosus]CAF1409048.1 unnamed protein product [Didymodactylos carnosus]CAF3686152.1 unnamed protein product [Didymodactylos carnosus]CAF4298753.1 unnamed protein product [Didymodactylos carnosus]